MSKLDDKEFYHELTEKQKAVVDEIVDDPAAQNTELADRAGVARSTVYNVKEHYGNIIESQLDQRGRHGGDEETVGDPFEALAGEKTRGVQYIGERPRQDDTGAQEETDAETWTVALELTEAEVRDVLERDTCEPIREAILRRVLDRAFAA